MRFIITLLIATLSLIGSVVKAQTSIQINTGFGVQVGTTRDVPLLGGNFEVVANQYAKHTHTFIGGGLAIKNVVAGIGYVGYTFNHNVQAKIGVTSNKTLYLSIDGTSVINRTSVGGIKIGPSIVYSNNVILFGIVVKNIARIQPKHYCMDKYQY